VANALKDSGLYDGKGRKPMKQLAAAMLQRQNSCCRALGTIAILVVALVPQSIRAATGYVQHNLASDIPLLADFTDPNLVNPWGLALSPFWICNSGTGTYNVNGADGAPTATITNVPLAGGLLVLAGARGPFATTTRPHS
jgi:hypothetical protein